MSKIHILNDDSLEVVTIDQKEFDKKMNDNVNIFDLQVSDSANTFEVYNIGTVSDKVINRRIYPEAKVLDTVINNRWLTPYYKPFLSNHDIEVTPLGRVIDNFYYDHYSKDVKGGNSILPKQVIDAFEKASMFDEGKGSVLLKLSVTDSCLDSIKKGIFLTTSQSSGTNSMTCNICGSDIYDCEHIPGKVYDDKLASALTGDLFPIENSIVNQPANDTSTLLIYNKDTKEITFLNKFHSNTTPDLTKDVEGAKIGEVKVNDSEKNNSNEGDNMEKQELVKLADALKKTVIANIIKNASLTEDAEVEKINAVVNSFGIAELNNIVDLAEVLTGTTLEKISTKDSLISSLNDKVATLEAAIELKDKEISDKIAEVEEFSKKSEAEAKLVEDKKKEEEKEKEEEKKEKEEDKCGSKKEEKKAKDSEEEETTKEVKDTVVPNFLETETKNNKLNDLFGNAELIF